VRRGRPWILGSLVTVALPSTPALAATGGVDWALEAARLALALTLVFGSAGIGFWLARLRQMRDDALLRNAFDALPQPRQIVDSLGRVVAANAACRETLDDPGTPIPEQLAARAGGDEETVRALKALADRAGAGASGQVEVRLREVDGGPGWRLVAASPIPERPGSILWRLEDITHRRRAEETERREDERRAQLVDTAPVGFFSTTADGRFVFANATFARWLGRGVEELTRDPIRLHDVLAEPPADAAPYDPIGGGGEGRGEVRLRHRDGKLIDVVVAQDLVGRGESLRTRAVVFDVTEQRDWERRLRLTSQRFQQFFDKAPIGVALVDLKGRVTECNSAFREILAQGRDGVEGTALWDLVRSESREAVIARMGAPGEAGRPPAPIDIRVQGRDDTVAALYLARLDDERGVAAGFVCHVIDATEQKRLEAQFAQSQKMQAVGQLAGGIAHDFNNLLTAMIGFCDLLLLRHRPGDQSFADIMQVKQNANRAANLVRQLLAFSRQQTLQPRVLNVADALAELSHLLRRLIGENIELKMVHGRDLGLVRVDQGQLEQVIINLAVNARDAMLQGGAVTIRTSNYTSTAPMRRGAEVMPPGDYVRIEVADAGTGIAPEIIDRIFEPFFSTKEVGAGTGLGLSTVYGIVRQTGGFVFVESRPGEGALFSIYLPVHAAAGAAGEMIRREAAEAAEAQGSGRDLTGIGTILLVEDEDAVRLFGARALRNKGYNVIEAPSGEAALEAIASHTTPIDLLITDVVMPRMDGPTLIRKVREQWPQMKVVFISGYAEDAFRKRLDETADIHFLPKPFSLKQLAGKVKEVMEAPPRSEAATGLRRVEGRAGR
jgi:two-component system cell cycle sensor histidine kinase/response regulator CckA